MKPLRLTLDAIGPYPGRQVVDFQTALQSRLFGIYGPTGAGKSTIFSAMTFALFGEAAKSEQHPSTLRSDYADSAHMTEVEFIFENRGRVYRVVRRPEQMRPAKRGGGETKEGHKATLFDVTGLDLAAVGEALPGRVVAESKVEVVNKEIINLLGYGPAQFRQIVLLPQGRFETFLAANTQDRLKILRELFDVSLYRRLAEQIKANADTAEAKVRTARDVCSGRLLTEGYATPAELAAGTDAARSDLAQHRETAATAKMTADAATQAYQSAALTDQAFAEHAEADKAVKALVAQAGTIADLSTRITCARAAQLLIDVEQAVDTARKTLGDTAQLAATAARSEQEAEGRAVKAAGHLNGLSDKTADHERDRAELQACEAHAKRLEASAGLQDAATKATAKALSEKTRAERSKAVHAEQTRAHGDVVRTLEGARTAALRRAALRTQEAEANQALQSAKHYERARTQLASDTAALERLDADAATAMAQLGVRQGAFNEAEAALLQNHALHVAGHLIEGEPCPACGSRDHPAPAHGSVEVGSVATTYQREKTALESARKRSEDARTQAAAARETLARRQTEFGELPVPARAAKALAEELASIRSALEALGPDVDLDALDAKRVELENAVATTLATHQSEASMAQESDKAAALARQSLDDALQSVPADLRLPARLAERREALTRKVAEFAAALEAARKHERDTNDALIAARTAAAHAAATKANAEAQLRSAQSSFAQRLAEAGFSEAQYRGGKADLPRLPELEAQIAAHREQMIRADERLRKAAAAIENTDRPDLKALKDTKDAAEAALAAANDLVAGTNARIQHLEKLANELSAEIARLDRLEQETGPLRELADAFTGRNDMKMELETFAIATMFDHVLEAANLRLGPMTRGRYMLVRETEGRGNARRGLGLSIDDANTGRQRPASTLSGGETFIAALALALGLSDVVESTRGNIRLDTIFIDEGFGSLDGESDAGTLERVLETLQDHVGRNRAVGLISHVPLVQQAIPNGFWIIKSATGSQIEMRA
jgi:exonuclease SbcC